MKHESIEDYVATLSDIKSMAEDSETNAVRFSAKCSPQTLDFIDAFATFYGQTRASVLENIIEASTQDIFKSIPKHEKLSVLQLVKANLAQRDLDGESVWEQYYEAYTEAHNADS
uniref:hypothetical protein n=1 Tax=Ningiella ruwaisensis TaxID=2364274 RepID=UPI00109FCE9F|nr:hypothetical protein [Ningiella ruwaisensis]